MQHCPCTEFVNFTNLNTFLCTTLSAYRTVTLLWSITEPRNEITPLLLQFNDLFE
jgi:hypothetical protein